MELKTISLNLAIEFPEEKIKISDFIKELITKIREIKEFKVSKEKEIILELESDSFKFLITPVGIMGRLKEKYSIDTVFIELEGLLNSITKVITDINKNASCGIDIRVIYRGDFSSIINKVISKDKMEIAKKKINITSFLIDLKEKDKECPFNIEMYSNEAMINIFFCVGSPKICKKELCIMPAEVRISEKVQIAKKVIEGLL